MGEAERTTIGKRTVGGVVREAATGLVRRRSHLTYS